MMFARLLSASLAFPFASLAAQGEVPRTDFARDVLPILEKRCFECHREAVPDSGGRLRRPKAGLRLDGKGWILKGATDNVVVIPGKPERSSLYTRTTLAPDDDDIMPNKGAPLSEAQTEVLRRWIAEGCDFGPWSGKPGPEAAVIERAQAAASPDALASDRMRTLAELAEGLAPALPAAVDRAAGKKCQVEPVQPGSPLLRVTFVSNEAAVGDADLVQLQPLSGHITYLGLAKTKLSDAGLAALVSMRRLTRLDLNRTAITDAGMASIAKLRELRYLNLHGTAVTDAGLRELAHLSRLEALYLWNTKVTPAGVEALRVALPGARIHHELELPAGGERPQGGAGRRRR